MKKIDLEALFRVYPQTPAEAEVRDWLKKCKHVFTEEMSDPWTLPEIAHLAVREAGFDIAAVCAVMSHWRDAMDGSRFERRQAQEEYRLENAIESFRELQAKLAYVEELDLRPQWKELAEYQGGTI